MDSIAQKYAALHPYTGSKQKKKIRNWLLSHFPDSSSYRTYVEPFAGAASVLLALPRAEKEVLVEKCSHQAALLKVLKDHAGVLMLRCAGLGATEALEERLFDMAVLRHRYVPLFDDLVDRAKYQLIRNCLSWHSKGTSFKWRRNKKGKSIRPTFQQYVERAVAASGRLEGVEIRQGEGMDWVWDHNRKTTFFYLDPPYLLGTRTSKKLYNQELDDDAHARILDIANRLRGKVAISGYRSELYDRALPRRRWKRHTLEVMAVKTKRTEVLWTNY